MFWYVVGIDIMHILCVCAESQKQLLDGQTQVWKLKTLTYSNSTNYMIHDSSVLDDWCISAGLVMIMKFLKVN